MKQSPCSREVVPLHGRGGPGALIQVRASIILAPATTQIEITMLFNTVAIVVQYPDRVGLALRAGNKTFDNKTTCVNSCIAWLLALVDNQASPKCFLPQAQLAALD